MKDHPVVTRLVELRTYLEKVRPVDKKMQYQIDKLLAAGAKAAAGGLGGGAEGADTDADPLSFKPNPNSLVARAEQRAAEEVSGGHRWMGGIIRWGAS